MVKSRLLNRILPAICAFSVAPAFADQPQAYQLCQDFTAKKLEKMSNDSHYLGGLSISKKSPYLKQNFLEKMIQFSPQGEVDVSSQSGVEYNDSTGDLKILLDGTGGPGSSFIHLQFGYDTSNSSQRRVNSVREYVETPASQGSPAMKFDIGQVNLAITGNGQTCIPDRVTGLQGSMQFSASGCRDLQAFYKDHPAMKHCDDMNLKGKKGAAIDIQCEDLLMASQMSAIMKNDHLPVDAVSYQFVQNSCQDAFAQPVISAYTAEHKNDVSAPQGMAISAPAGSNGSGSASGTGSGAASVTSSQQ